MASTNTNLITATQIERSHNKMLCWNTRGPALDSCEIIKPDQAMCLYFAVQGSAGTFH
jgi:hypothetical protein